MKKADIYSTTRLTESYWPADTSRPLCESTLGDELRKAAAEVPDRLALVEGILDAAKRRRWTYAQMLSDAERVASALLDRFKPGDRVAVQAPNRPEWVLLEYGCALAGMILVTVNPANLQRELEQILETSQSVALFVIDEYRGDNKLEAAKKARNNLPFVKEVISFSEFNGFMKSATMSTPFPKVSPKDPLMIIYTSGTTGVQKGALNHHLGRLNCDYFTVERAGLEEGGVHINPMPLFHNAGCGCVVVGSLRMRATHVLLPVFDVALLLNLFESEKGTFSLLVPTMVESILAFPDRKKYNLSTWKSFQSGASYVEKQLIERCDKELGVCLVNDYGQTEAHGVICGTHRDDSYEDQSTTIGQPLPQCEVKIADPETGKVLALNTEGEICIRGYQVLMAYYHMPEATAEAFRDGWQRTGDLGRMDERGFLKITGRLKDMIIRGGENIYPREIENLLLEHPKVGQVAVVGVPHPTWGEEVAAVIIPKSSGNLPSPKELHDFCRANLTNFKTPRLWCFLNEYPYTQTGKRQNFKLREMIVSGELKCDRT